MKGRAVESVWSWRASHPASRQPLTYNSAGAVSITEDQDVVLLHDVFRAYLPYAVIIVVFSIIAAIALVSFVVQEFRHQNPVVDVRMTTSLIDSYIYVVEWGRTKIDVVEHNLANAAGIYQFDPAILNFNRRSNSIARDTGRRINDGNPAMRQPIKQA